MESFKVLIIMFLSIFLQGSFTNMNFFFNMKFSNQFEFIRNEGMDFFAQI